MNAGSALREAVRRRAFAAPVRPAVAAAARELSGIAEGTVRAVVFFGSRRSGAARADSWSAYDLFVVVDRYGAFYRALHRGGLIHRSPWLMAAVSRILPPSQVSLRLHDAEGGSLHAKCSVIEMRAFLRETSARRRDHFCIGRLFQPAEAICTADQAAADDVLSALVSAHVETYAWVRPWLPEAFDAEAYCRRLLEVSLGQEIRPEPEGRAQALFAAQREEIVPAYDLLLRELAAAGDLRAAGEKGFALARPVGSLERLRVRGYFLRSLVRATLRWGKHMVTFEDWLDYILRKVRRHGGGDIELSERERRLPLLFLWPRLFRYLRHKDH